jgi:hypothetical protein
MTDDIASAFRRRQLAIAGTESPLQELVDKLEAADAVLKEAKASKDAAAVALYEAMAEIGVDKWRYTASDGTRRVAELKRTTKVVLRIAGPDDVDASTAESERLS